MRVRVLQPFCFFVFLSALGSLAARWQYTRIGPPQVQLVDATLQAYERAAVPTQRPAIGTQPQNWQDMVGAVSAAAAANGLQVESRTRADGNCGPDSVLRNLECLNVNNTAVQQVLHTLAQEGRDAALLKIRRLCGAWLRRHSANQVIPGVTVNEWVMMGSLHSSFASHIQSWEQPGTWVEAPLLHAASAVFNLQIVVFLCHCEPPLIACVRGVNGVRVAQEREGSHAPDCQGWPASGRRLAT